MNGNRVFTIRHLDARSPYDKSATVHTEMTGGSSLRAGTGPALILIHGYANPPPVAAKRYEAFLTRLLDEALARTHRLAPVEVFCLYWPGYHPSEAMPLNWLSFSARVGPANHSGDLLGAVLDGSARGRVVVVAHSLGCRVALRALTKMHDTDTAGPSARTPPIRAVLMAAAVPVTECAERELSKQPTSARAVVLHSLHDTVLRDPYPLGQGLVDRTDEAVGRRGRPEGPRWHRRVQTRHKHGDYWDATDAVLQVMHELWDTRLPVTLDATRGPIPSLPRATGRSLPERALPSLADPRGVPAPRRP